MMPLSTSRVLAIVALVLALLSFFLPVYPLLAIAVVLLAIAWLV